MKFYNLVNFLMVFVFLNAASTEKKYYDRQTIVTAKKKAKEKINYFGSIATLCIKSSPNAILINLHPLTDFNNESLSYIFIFKSTSNIYLGFYRLNNIISKIESDLAKSIFNTHLDKAHASEIYFTKESGIKNEQKKLNRLHYVSHENVLPLLDLFEEYNIQLTKYLSLSSTEKKFQSASLIFSNMYVLSLSQKIKLFLSKYL